ncbi:MAG: glycosyltransferase family 4 protein [Polaribacter sp.]
MKFVKYLPEFGVEPIVYCPENPNYLKTDETLLQEVSNEVTILKVPVTDVSKFALRPKKKSTSGVANATNNKLLSFIRGNFFTPDAKVLWVNPSVEFLTNYLTENPVDVIISTGPPHSMHLIAQKLKESFGIPWMADFRDPWTDLYYNKDFYQLGFAKRKNNRLEERVLKTADMVVTVGNELKKYFDRFNSNVEVITNGYDDEVDNYEKIELSHKFSLSYIGLLPKSSLPTNLLIAIQRLIEEKPEFNNDIELNFVGDIHESVSALVSELGLSEYTNFLGYVPHNEAIKYQKSAWVLLVIIPNVEGNKGIITGKVFEYMAANRPILALGPTDGDLQTILNDSNAGTVIDYDDLDKIKSVLIDLYTKFKNRKLAIVSQGVEKYHRRNLTKQLATIIKQVKS